MSIPYDTVIVGGGVAGMTAGVYAARYLLKTVILEKAILGGQPAVAEQIENFPGFPELDGWDLSTRLEKHLKGLGVDVIEPEEVGAIETQGNLIRVTGSQGVYLAKSVIIAAGGQPRLLGVPGEKRFARKGVHYCAQCAGLGYEGKRVAVVGGGESALLGALYLSEIAEEVVLIHRRIHFRGEKILQRRITESDKIKMIRESLVEAIHGDSRVSGIKVRNGRNGRVETLDVDALFVYVGYVPNTAFVHLEKNGAGFIEVNLEMETSLPGIFACGNAIREDAQIISSMGEGCVAAMSASKYIMEQV
ncbi:MAG: FAD-dependent oxidoreductase [bacterium]|nr:FAD-dependent oxidoreductase [bacterium]